MVRTVLWIWAILNILLQRVLRDPQDRALRLRAAEQVANLAEHAVDPYGTDKLLGDAVAGARLLRRALERSNKSEPPSGNDLAAVSAWIDGLHGILLKIIERPTGPS
jgi:hypothetical protein